MKWKNKLNKFFGRKNMSNEATRGPRYPVEMLDQMVTSYQDTPTRATVNALAAEHDRPVRGVIAKLVQAGVYVKQERVVKTPSEPVIRKSELVEQIQAALGVQFTSLNKASKADLEQLLQAVR
jgi:hypothetical protein